MVQHKSRLCRYVMTSAVLCASMSIAAAPRVSAEDSPDTPVTRLQPIGAPSAVDQYRPRAAAVVDETRHTVRLMQFEAPQLPTGPTAPPMSMPGTPTLAPPVAPPTIAPSPSTQTIMPPSTPPSVVQPFAPRGLPMNTTSPVPMMQPVPSSSDLAPLAAPQLQDGFATIDNCCCVSAPSDYVAATGWGNCSSVAYQAPAPQAYITPNAQVVGPSVVTTPVPVVATPVVVTPATTPKAAGIPKKPLLNFGQDKNPVVVGQGLVGQPVAYVPGQRFRNWIRYIFP
ncbi:MAG: hypothetical protein ACR2NZ_11855 [Rubripirellula sp.]